ncbi:MAG: hypothetical protein JXR52_06540 [Bacteroidales bacterium]|nr:hypothetical protein [Bacteroidales bacterium]MBN2698467.1 hypothetical protein [Bacteroidales bacterium]
MKEDENLYDKIEELFGKDPGNLNILEHKIDIDLQMEYFDCSRRVTLEYDEEWAEAHSEYLFDPVVPAELKKTILARLATIEKVECYRIIEAYLSEPDEALKEWAILSLFESKMHLQGDILDRNQIFISTGLGGRDDKLRYFIVLIARGGKDLDKLQKRIIRSEFKYVLKKYDAEIEKIQFSGYLATVILLIPLQFAIKQVSREIIDACNLYGDFLRENFIVTNVKLLSFNEIKEFIERKKDR